MGVGGVEVVVGVQVRVVQVRVVQVRVQVVRVSGTGTGTVQIQGGEMVSNTAAVTTGGPGATLQSVLYRYGYGWYR